MHTARNVLALVSVVLAMALAAVVTAALQTGKTLVEVTSPSHELLMRASSPAPADVEACITSDAEQRPAGEEYAYAVHFYTPDKGEVSKHTERVRGRKPVAGAEDEHRVDVASTNTTGAALGHVVRALVETQRALVSQSKEVTAMGLSAMKSERALRKQLLEADGEMGIARMVIEHENKSKDMWGQRIDTFVGKVLGLGQGVAAGRGLLPAAAASDAVAELRSSLTSVQRTSILRVVGPEAWAAIGWAASAEQLADVFWDAVGEAKTREVAMTCGLDQQQVQRFMLLCKPRWEARQKARDEQQAKNGAEKPPEGQAST